MSKHSIPPLSQRANDALVWDWRTAGCSGTPDTRDWRPSEVQEHLIASNIAADLADEEMTRMEYPPIPAASWPAARRRVRIRRLFRVFWPVAIGACLVVVAALMVVGVVLTVMGDPRADVLMIGAILAGLAFSGAGHFMGVFHA